MPTLMGGDAPMGGSQARYAQVATDESGRAPLEVEAPSGPLGSGAPPVMRKPAFWAAVLVVALGASVMLSGPAASVVIEPETEQPAASVYTAPALRGSEDSTLTALIAENSRLRSDLAAKSHSSAGASDEAFSALFEENGRLRSELASKAPASSGTFDIGAYRAERLAATPPNIIECAEATAGESQEACHLLKERRFEAIGQKGITLWMTGLSGSGKSTIARALEEALVLKYGKVVQQLDGDNVRTGLNRDLGFTPADRDESVRRVGELACLFNGGGVITLVTLVSPYRAARDVARQRHADQHLSFLEVFMNVPIDEVKKRDPKGLYAKVATGEITSFTGMSADAPYEAPVRPEVDLPNRDLSVDECVNRLLDVLRREGVLEGGVSDPSGLPLPPGYVDGWLEDSLRLTGSAAVTAKTQAKHLPMVRLNDIDVNWLQVIGEGWAAPLKGFMRESVLLQSLHFNSVLIDPFGNQGSTHVNEEATNWESTSHSSTRASLAVPIVLPITSGTRDAILNSGSRMVALVDKDGKFLGHLKDPEIYVNRKEEIISRCFGAIDNDHPYIAHIQSGGDYLLGGEIELFDRMTYDDGLDKWRKTPKELYGEFKAKGADVVFAFQTRNPTHAGHAYLMKTGRDRLIAKGHSNPVLWLSPLGGWTKSDDVPLDVRVKQHQAILDEGMLDPSWTVMGIWPAPMIYAGPTEVQFHAASRRAGGASFFVVGRDAAGIKGSSVAVAHQDDDMYDANHARFVLQASPLLDDGVMQLLSFDKFFYDKTDHTMKAMDPSREDDFISISGSKMRALARQGATPCRDPIPSDLLAANCVPQGFMVPTGWAIVCDYYQNIDSGNFIPWSKREAYNDQKDSSAVEEGRFGTTAYSLFPSYQGKKMVSPWHDIPLKSGSHYNFVTEIPMWTSAKMEVSKEKYRNPIMQDTNKDGSPRYYTYGVPFFNYGLLPQTWEDPALKSAAGYGGDNDPLDVIEVGEGPLAMGSTTPIIVLGSLELIDEGETDHKIIGLRASDPRAATVRSLADLERSSRGLTARLVDWLKMYKTSDGKGVNNIANGERATSASEAEAIIAECEQRWRALLAAPAARPEFWLPH